MSHASVTAATRTERARRHIVRLVNQQLTLGEFFAAADMVLRNMVGYDVSCWLSLDPSTLLPTAHYAPQTGSEHLMALVANEFLEEDVNKFADLAHAAVPAATLLDATEGDPRRSARYRNTFEPMGHTHGDELRAVLRDDDTAWGGIILHRLSRRFDSGDIDLIVRVGPLFAEGIRRAIMSGSAARGLDEDSPGTMLLGSSDAVEGMTPSAKRWLAEIVEISRDPDSLPLAIRSVADKARRIGAGRDDDVARTRVPLRNGGWLLAHGALLDGESTGRVVVTLSPSLQPQIAGVIVATYGLSRREREITMLVLAGMSTEEIAGRLAITRYTVQDHLKSVFDKVGVRSRRDLVAEVFFRHYAPQLASGHESAAAGAAVALDSSEPAAVADH